MTSNSNQPVRSTRVNRSRAIAVALLCVIAVLGFLYMAEIVPVDGLFSSDSGRRSGDSIAQIRSEVTGGHRDETANADGGKPIEEAHRIKPRGVDNRLIKQDFSEQGRTDGRLGHGLNNRDIRETPADEARPPHGIFSIAGRVLNEAGGPVAGIEVKAIAEHYFSEPEDGVEAGEAWRAYSDTHGAFEFVGLPDGEFSLSAGESQGYPPAKATVRAGGDGVRLVLRQEKQVWISGRITSLGGDPLSGAEIFATSQPDHIVYSQRSGAYGIYITVKRDSAINVSAQAAGYEDQTITLAEDDWFKISQVERDIVMRPLEALAAVSGTVSDRQGLPVANEMVYLKGENRQYSGATDESGTFRIDDVETGTRYLLWIRPAGPYKQFQKQNLEVPAGGVDALAVVLDNLETATLTGLMMDVEGNPIPNFTMTLSSRDAASTPVRVTSNEKGYFSTNRAPGGALRLETASDPLLMVNGVRLSPGEEKDIDVVLDIGDYTLQGRTVDDRGEPVAGASLSLAWALREDGLAYESFRKTVSDTNGLFRFSRLGPGRHNLIVRAPRFKTAQVDFQMGDRFDPSQAPVEVPLEYASD